MHTHAPTHTEMHAFYDTYVERGSKTRMIEFLSFVTGFSRLGGRLIYTEVEKGRPLGRPMLHKEKKTQCPVDRPIDRPNFEN